MLRTGIVTLRLPMDDWLLPTLHIICRVSVSVDVFHFLILKVWSSPTLGGSASYFASPEEPLGAKSIQWHFMLQAPLDSVGTPAGGQLSSCFRWLKSEWSPASLASHFAVF
jgi:hypothetical protein